MRKVFLLFLIALILETVFYPYPFTLLAVIMSVLGLSSESILWAFAVGFLLDIAALRPLGVNSLIFLSISGFMLRYNRKVYFANIVYLLIFTLLAVFLYSYFFYRQILSVQAVIMTVIISYLLLYFLPYIFSFTKGRGKLSV